MKTMMTAFKDIGATIQKLAKKGNLRSLEESYALTSGIMFVACFPHSNNWMVRPKSTL